MRLAIDPKWDREDWLHEVVHEGDFAFVEVLLDAEFLDEATVNTKDTDGKNLLHAVLEGLLDKIYKIVQIGQKGRCRIQRDDGIQEQVGVAQLLISAGADVGAADKHGNTPIDVAKAIGKCIEDGCKAMKEPGANVASAYRVMFEAKIAEVRRFISTLGE